MSQREIEVILTRQLASHLAMPIFLVDPAGTLVYYNEPAESILGRRFEETGELPANEWATVAEATDDTGAPLAADQLPLMIAVRERRPAHGVLWVLGRDGVRRRIVVMALPLIGHGGRHLGGLAVFWESAG